MKNNLRLMLPAALAAILCLAVFCTIKDDNGNLIDPGNPPEGTDGGQIEIIDSSDNPIIVVTPGQVIVDSNYYVRIGDTIILSVRIKSANATLTKDAKISVTMTPDTDRWISSRNLTTNANGIATVKFSSSVAGQTELTFKNGKLETKLQIVATDTPPNKMAISASLLPDQTDGTSKSIITIQVKNAFNNPIVGETVTFYSDAGIITASGVTDSEGKAAAELTSGKGDEFATVTAVLVNDPKCTAEITITFIEDTGLPLKRIYFNNPNWEFKNGIVICTMTVLVKNNYNNPLDEEVRFISTAGMIDAIGEPMGRGKYSVILTRDWDFDSTCATVTAFLTSDTTCRGTRTVCFPNVARNIMTATADKVSINKNGKDTSTVTATLRNDAGSPIVGEPVTFTSTLDAAEIIIIDSVTNNSGEARAKILGKNAAPDSDIITVSGGNATSTVTIAFSINTLRIFPVSGTPAMNFVANPENTTTFRVEYTQPSGATIGNSVIEVSVTMGNMKDRIVFAEKYTGTSGRVDFTINNPGFTDTATIRATAYTLNSTVGITTKDTTQYFRASAVKRIELTVTPAVIGTTTGRATLTATAFDNDTIGKGNRVQDEVISFNLLKAPGGGEYISPATSTTLADGTAKSYLYAGTIPSAWRGVEVVASDFTGVRSNTVNFTIAGPPKSITVRRNMGEINVYTATYGKQFSVLVSDVNGNPVADGTEVTFSAQITGYRYFFNDAGYVTEDGVRFFTDTLIRDTLITSELPPNSIKSYKPYPPFKDINRNGRPDRYYRTKDKQNPVERCGGPIDSDGDCIGGVYADYNNDGWSEIEEFDFCKRCLEWSTVDTQWVLKPGAYDSLFTSLDLDPTHCAVTDSATLSQCLDSLYKNEPFSLDATWHIDWNRNGVPDPSTTVLIARTVQTKDGIADNELIYGQSDAWRIQVKVWAEAQGLVTSSPEQFVLPLLEGADKYWSYFE